MWRHRTAKAAGRTRAGYAVARRIHGHTSSPQRLPPRSDTPYPLSRVRGARMMRVLRVSHASSLSTPSYARTRRSKGPCDRVADRLFALARPCGFPLPASRRQLRPIPDSGTTFRLEGPPTLSALAWQHDLPPMCAAAVAACQLFTAATTELGSRTYPSRSSSWRPGLESAPGPTTAGPVAIRGKRNRALEGAVGGIARTGVNEADPSFARFRRGRPGSRTRECPRGRKRRDRRGPAPVFTNCELYWDLPSRRRGAARSSRSRRRTTGPR